MAVVSSDALPVRTVTLFSSGVAHVVREGALEAGEAIVALTFRIAQINDLLKSLVLLDDGGVVRAATLPTRDPVGRTLQAFALNVSDNPSRFILLERLRGIPIAVETTNGETVSGRVLSVEQWPELLDNERQVVREAVTLTADAGLVTIPLDKVRRFQVQDTRLSRELQEALAALASGSDDNRRTITVTFSGAQARTVRVAYITESPVWKISYRLVLDDTSPPYLQGWAIVENTSDDDWQAITLSLVSGRPISFIQDLYTPLYVQRPVVGPDVEGAPLPELHRARIEPSAFAETISLSARDMQVYDAPAAAPTPMVTRSLKREAMQQAVPVQATGQQSGELFEYRISTPVHLPRQQAAMIPVVSETFEGEKLSLYNADADSRFPRNAFRLKNTTRLPLKGGSITVFDGGVYAGDARIENILPGDERLITYAVDLAIEGERQRKKGRMHSETLIIRRGVLERKQFWRETTGYAVRSRAEMERTILIEHPFDSGETLVEPAEPAERTADRYRFRLVVPAQSSAFLTVTTERVMLEKVALFDGSKETLLAFSTNDSIPGTLKAALAEVLARRNRLEDINQQIVDREAERERIHDEQKRIQSNMSVLDKDAALYRRYIETLDQQESRLAELLAELTRLVEERNRLQAELRAYLSNLSIG